MCLYVLLYKIHPKYPIILAGNRDEFYERKAFPIHWWKESPSVLGGIDLREGGSWLAVNRRGKFAVVTNYRDPQQIKDSAVSRGSLVSNFVRSDYSCIEYLETISANNLLYNGYNLIFGDCNEIFYFSNVVHEHTELKPGVYTLSNHLLDTPWYKSDEGKTDAAGFAGE